MESFDSVYRRAVQRKGSESALLALLSKPLTEAELLLLTGDQWLEAFTCKIFQSVFYWSVIRKKWPGFKEVFWDFDIDKLLLMPPEMLEQKSQDERIVRNYKKVKTIAVNVQMIRYACVDAGSQNEKFDFLAFIAKWPEDDIVGLWLWLKKHGGRLGGNTGPYALRAMGKNTFILSRDVEAYLRAHRVIEGGLQSKKSLLSIQAFFNDLREQSGLSLQELSQIIAFSCGDNSVQIGVGE